MAQLETVEGFLARGGQIERCPDKLEGTQRRAVDPRPDGKPEAVTDDPKCCPTCRGDFRTLIRRLRRAQPKRKASQDACGCPLEGDDDRSLCKDCSLTEE